MKPITMNATDRRELLQLLQEEHGSKSAAIGVVKGLTPEGQRSLLLTLQRKRLERAGQRSLPLASSPASVASSGAALKPKRAKKVPYSLLVPEDDLDALRALADQQDVTVSHLIRQAIKHALRGRRS